MPIIPTYTKREFIKTPGVDSSAPAPTRLNNAYENGLTRTARLIPQAVAAASKLAGDGGKGSAPAAGVGASSVSADEDLRLRENLVNTLQHELADSQNVSVGALEQAAAKHFTPQTSNTAAARDYAVLRRAAQEAQEVSASAQARQAAVKEKTLTCQVGSLVRSPQALEAYLTDQLASYEERLRANGENGACVRASSRAVRAQTVEENICRSLSCGDWKAAEATLGAHGNKLADGVQQACAAKTRALFARSRAETLWEEARLETGASAEQIGRYALANLRESDAELNAQIRQALLAYTRRESAQEHLSSAQVLASAAQLPSAQALRVLDAKSTLPVQEWEQARQAALALDGDVTRSDEQHYVACYFDGTQKEHTRLWKRDKISSRDYLRLESVRHRRQGGESFRAQELLCRGIDVWMRKKGFSAQDVLAAQYAVLTADAPNGSLGDVWKQIKNLLDV